MKSFLKTHARWLVVLYGFVYFPWFFWLESRADQPYHVIHLALDDKIPFCEYFIIPYLMWFVYIAAVFAYIFLKGSNREYIQTCIFLGTGMTLFLVISTVYPNGHLLRPTSFERQNICTLLVQLFYRIDTATDIFPSLHVFNAIGAHLALANNPRTGARKGLMLASGTLMVLIILATMFLKQHSTADVMAGILLGVVLNQVIYRTEWSTAAKRRRARAKAAF